VPLKLFSAIALLAVANGALINLVMASRLLYGMARERVVPAVFGVVHPRRATPWVAIVATAALSAVMVAFGTLKDLAATTVMLLLVVFVLVNVACLVLRRERVDHAHFVAPRVFPVLGIAVSLVLLGKQVADEDARTLVLTGLLLALGVALWLASRAALRREPPVSSPE
jgi:amino acid transporter